MPAVYGTGVNGPGVHWDLTKPTILSSVYGTYISSWLYGATVEMTQAATTPPWSNDTWSFVPIDFTNMTGELNSLSPNNGSISGLHGLPYNVTIETQALRARLVCRQLDVVSNVSTWSSKWDFNNKTVDRESNRTLWNSTNKPQNLDFAYELHSEIINPQMKYNSVPMGPGTGYLTCCSNMTNGVPGDAAIGYWTDNSTFNPIKPTMVARWVVGQPLEGLYNDTTRDGKSSGTIQGQHWFWIEQPSLVAISCEPIIEQATASVTVDIGTGIVRNYTILDKPKNATGAWSDNYLSRNMSSDYSGSLGYGSVPQTMNITARYFAFSLTLHKYLPQF